MGYELVSFKGMGDGVKINIDAQASVYDILDELEQKINSSKAFFGDGNCNIRFDGRQFSLNEKRLLKELMCRLLPLANVNFASSEKKEPPSNDWIVEYKEKREKTEVLEEPPVKKKLTDEDFLSVLRSNRARLYQGVVHEGMTIRSDGHLVLLGMVEMGAELIAVGNILVIGGLYGKAHAGCNGHNGSYIMAMDMKPQKLAIAGHSEEYLYEQDEPEDNTVQEPNKKSFFGKFRKKETDEMIEGTEETEFSAVALLKNNKINFDNFTYKIFTNLKNMV